MSSPEVETSGPSLRLVLGVMSVVVVVLGVLAYWRYVVSENHFAEVMARMDEQGKVLDTEGCIDAVLDWHAHCEANKPLCDNGVPHVLTHCLAGQDRSSTCESLDLSSAKAQWVFNSCLERGTPCQNQKKCVCADAYRAIDSYCRHDQQGTVAPL
ncbi:MAG: hypothetical protein H6712_16810 [Myxococcales bacterium]|nr:hypothetical protein [Myxococcales bacterium]MCB9715532.1 hypothetical protein [Myxococcales bacterium]